MSGSYDDKTVSYLVLNRDVVYKFGDYLSQLLNLADKILLIGDGLEDIADSRAISVEANQSKSIGLEGGYSFSGWEDGFKVDDKSFCLLSPHLIQINPETLELKVIKYDEEMDFVRGRVVKKLEENVAYP
jgi:hypothetical protein